MDDFLIKIFGYNWRKDFKFYFVIGLVSDAISFVITADLFWMDIPFPFLIMYFCGIILIIILSSLWFAYKRITPKIIQSILSRSLSKIKLLMPFDENGHSQQPGCWLWGILLLVQILAMIAIWFFY